MSMHDVCVQDVELGQEVGYNIRFENLTTQKTKLKYMTGSNNTTQGDGMRTCGHEAETRAHVHTGNG